MIVVNDIIQKNDADIIVKVCGCNPMDKCDCLQAEYYFGKLGDIPDNLRFCEVIQTGWLLGSQCHCIEIPFLNKECTE